MLRSMSIAWLMWLSIGYGRSDHLIRNHATIGDYIILAGGATGSDGIGGARFASKGMLEQNRSAVQVPDPLKKKLLIEGGDGGSRTSIC